MSSLVYFVGNKAAYFFVEVFFKTLEHAPGSTLFFVTFLGTVYIDVTMILVI